MRLCLNMIVRDEAHVLERCLDSVLPHIQSWAIVDTGSVDGTQALIHRRLGHLAGALIERPWVDFSVNRNQALELARLHGDYALIIDADDTLDVVPGRSFAGLTHPGYALEIVNSVASYWRDAILRLDVDWFWKGVVHEYPDCSRMDEVPRLGGARIRVVGGGARSRDGLQQKHLRDAELLRQALASDPGDARHAFYYAQCLRDGGDFVAALAAYERRVALGGWADEVFYSLYSIALLRQRLAHPEPEVVAAYLAAARFDPHRAEPLCFLAGYLLEHGRYAEARDHARAACALAVPAQGLQVNRATYGWLARSALSGALFALGDHAGCLGVCREMLADMTLPPAERQRVEQNIRAATTAQAAAAR